MKIAIVGAGLAGLALAIECKKATPQSQIMLFDPQKAENRTSALAQLLYPFAGLYCKLNWEGEKSFNRSISLLNETQNFTQKKFFNPVKLLKTAHTPKQVESFKEAAKKYLEVEFTPHTDYGLAGVWISNAIQIEAVEYLNALEMRCFSLGIVLQSTYFIDSMKEEFDHVIYASGYACQKLFPNLKLSLLKGQALILKRPDDFSLDYNLLIHQLHILPSFDQQSVYVGNTFERDPIDFNPNRQVALELLWPDLIQYFPMFSKNDLIEVKSGIRLNAPSRLPMISRLDSKTWVFSAFGSKGLLYHAYLSELLAKHLDNPDQQLPKEVYYNTH